MKNLLMYRKYFGLLQVPKKFVVRQIEKGNAFIHSNELNMREVKFSRKSNLEEKIIQFFQPDWSIV